MAHDPLAATYERALEVERARNARQIDFFRFLGAAAVLLVNTASSFLRSGYSGPPVRPLVLYTLAAGAVLWLRRRSAWMSRWSGLAVPFVDMPVVAYLVGTTAAGLHARGIDIDAAAVATQTPIFFILLIIAASLSLDNAFIWLAAGMAIALQSWFLFAEGRDATFVAAINVTTVLAAWLSLYARRRSVALVEHAALEQARRERVGRYFSPQMTAQLMDLSVDFGSARRCDVTVLFADLRDFTALAESLDSGAVLALLNDFHSRMVECLFARGGTLDKYLGDGLMAYFGAPLPQEDHADRALLCALDMQRAMSAMNRDRAARSLAPLRLGIGLHTGPVVLGDIGAEQRREYTAIGDTVNVASRIEQYTKVAGAPVLASEATRSVAGTAVHFTALEEIELKGKSAPIRLYSVEDADPIATR